MDTPDEIMMMYLGKEIEKFRKKKITISEIESNPKEIWFLSWNPI